MPGVIFDLDGVLVNSEPYWQRGFAEIVNELCLERGLPNPGLLPEQMARFQGGRVNDTVRAILGELGLLSDADSTTVSILTDRVIDHVAQRFLDAPDPIDSSVWVARQLAERGVPLAVASSSAQRFIDAALDAIGLADAFCVTQSALDLVRGKPDPEVYILTLARMGLEARDVVAIEDSTTGLGAALRAGLATIWLLEGSDEEEWQSLERLRASLGPYASSQHLLRKVTKQLALEDVTDVMRQL